MTAFTTLLAAPSAAHALRVGRTEGLFHASSDALFLHAFAPRPPEPGAAPSRAQAVRRILPPERFVRAAAVPAAHPLDGRAAGAALNVVVVCALHALDRLEKVVFAAVGARFVPGLEPWRRWERAADPTPRE